MQGSLPDYARMPGTRFIFVYFNDKNSVLSVIHSSRDRDMQAEVCKLKVELEGLDMQKISLTFILSCAIEDSNSKYWSKQNTTESPYQRIRQGGDP